MPTAANDIRIEFLKSLGRALGRYGADASESERWIDLCARRVGMVAEINVTPTTMMASIVEEDGREHTVLVRTAESGIDLQSLSTVYGIASGVADGSRTAGQALAELRLLMAAPPRFALWVRVFASALGAGSLAVLLGGDWNAFLAGLPVGLAVGVFIALGVRFDRMARLTELLGGFVAAVATLLVGHLVPHISLPTVAIAGVILLLPGLSITVGVSELASRHLVAGTARLAGAATTLISLSLGSFIGFTVMSRLHLAPHVGAVKHGTPPIALVMAVLGTVVALTVSTNSRRSDIALVLGAVVVALLGARFGAWLVGPTLGVAVAALILGLCSNFYARVTKQPAALTLIPGLSVLVPGALGLRGVGEFLRSAAGGASILENALIIAAGLAIGLMVADAALPPHAPPREVAE